MTIQEIISAHEAANGFFFSSGAKRFFNSRILSKTWETTTGTFYFVTSEANRWDHSPRLYTIREFDPTSPRQINTIGIFQDYGTAAEANAEARRLARK